jgi:glycosyltransferase involved in cell wall biosynthesis
VRAGRIILFTPLPPAETGIADYSALLIRELSKHGIEIETVASAEEAERFQRPTGPHLLLYQVGNSSHHDFLFPCLRRHPGVLVLHDLVLHHSRLLSYLESDDLRAYRDDLGNASKRSRARLRLDQYRAEALEAYPEEGEDVAEIALRIGGGRMLYDFPLYEHLVRRSLVTAVHTGSALAEVLSRCPEARVRRIRMGTPLPPLVAREEARKRLGLPASELLLASFGLVTPEKRISTVLRALARLKAAGIRARYLLVGGAVPHYDPLAEARKVGVAEDLVLVGRVPEEDFRLYAFASDLCLNLRYPSAGETSATLLTLLACGRPVLVTDQVPVRDFPDAVVARSPLEGDEDGLYCDLMDLIRSERRRRELGEAAREYAEREASPEAMAADYLALLEAEATL